MDRRETAGCLEPGQALLRHERRPAERGAAMYDPVSDSVDRKPLPQEACQDGSRRVPVRQRRPLLADRATILAVEEVGGLGGLCSDVIAFTLGDDGKLRADLIQLVDERRTATIEDEDVVHGANYSA